MRLRKKPWIEEAIKEYKEFLFLDEPKDKREKGDKKMIDELKSLFETDDLVKFAK